MAQGPDSADVHASGHAARAGATGPSHRPAGESLWCKVAQAFGPRARRSSSPWQTAVSRA
jgi:hypothetical protein